MARTPRPVHAEIAPVVPREVQNLATSLPDRLWPSGDGPFSDPNTPDLDAFIEEFGYLLYRLVLSAVRLQCYVKDDLVFERACVRSDRRLEPGGYGLDPALAPLPEDARVRLVVTPNPWVPIQVRESVFRELGWPPAPALKRPEGAVPRVHKVERFESTLNGKTLRLYLVYQLYVNSKFSLGEYCRAMGIKPPWLRDG